jgi:hypothetical protein
MEYDIGMDATMLYNPNWRILQKKIKIIYLFTYLFSHFPIFLSHISYFQNVKKMKEIISFC